MEKENKKGLWLIIIIVAIVMGGIGWYAGTKFSNNGTKEKQSEKELKTKDTTEKTEKESENKDTTGKEETIKKNDKLIYLDTFVNKAEGLSGFYDAETVKLLSDKVLINRYSIDGNIVYYTNAKGDLFSFDITNSNEKPKEYDVLIENDSYFSISGDNLYMVVRGEDENKTYYAITYNLKTGKETKEKIDLSSVHVNGLISGSIFLIDDMKNANEKTYFYDYDFSTNKLTKLGTYQNVIENRKDYILFEKDSSQECLYDRKNNKELLCVKKDKTNKRVYGTLSTTNDGKIYVLDGNKIKECTVDNNCSKDYYTLTNEEANAPSLNMRFIDNNLLLTVGLNERCEAGCTYDYTTYNISDNHKKMNYVLELNGYNQGLFLE